MSLLSTAACFWQSTGVMAAPLSCSSIYADVNGGKAIYSINTTNAALTQAATLPVNSSIGIAAINVGGVPTVYSDSTGTIHLNYTNGTTTGNNTAATFTNPYGGGLGADAAGRLFYIGNNGTTQSLMRFATTTSPSTNIGTITSAIPNDTVWRNLSPGDMMSDANGRLYYFGSDYVQTGGLYTNYLYYVDASLVARRLGSYTSAQTGIGVAFDPSGTIYTLNRNLLYKIDLTEGFSATLVGDTGNNRLIDMASCALPTMNPNVSGTKTVRDVTTGENPATIVNTNDTLEYNVVITNTGNLPSDGSRFIDIIPPGSSYVTGSTKLCNATGVTCTTVADVSGSGPFVGSGMLVNTLGQSSGIVLAGAANNAIVKFQVKVTSNGNPVSIVNTGRTSYPTVNGGIVTINTPNTTATSILVASSLDYADAPDTSAGTATENYRTTGSDSGPNHVITAGLKLGATAPDADNGLQQNAAADADGADEDAFTSLPNVPTTGTYSLTNVPVTNTTGSTATLRAWVDFNNNGIFEAGEFASATVANNATTANLTWTVPAGTVVGSTYARFRLTTQALTDTAGTSEDERSIGAASNGEVEDYQVLIAISKANVIMVKRITAIKDSSTSNVTTYNSFVDDTTSPSKTNDNNCGWPGAVATAGVCTTNTYLKGELNPTAKIKPGDEIEYTIYYLNAGDNKAKQVRICDQLSSNLTFQGDTPTTPATTAPLDIRLFPGSAGPLESLTNSTDTDKGQLTTAALATSCNLAGNTGTNPSDNVVIVDVATPTK